jgi:hypothetical protein
MYTPAFERRALNNMAIENRNLPTGTHLWANYKKQRYVCTVEAGEESEVAFVLEDGSRHKSPSAAGSRVMGGKAVNGWRFWTVEGDVPPASNEKPAKKSRKQKQAKTLYKTPNQQDMAQGKTRYFCSACMDGFVHDGTDEPEACPKGHRNDDPELNAPSGVEEAPATV